jgi:uncharacterized protein
MEWIQDSRPAGASLDRLLAQAERGQMRLLMSAINVGEVYYFLRKHHSAGLADSWRASSSAMPVTIETPSLDDIWSAATLKGRYPIAYADAFGAALALKYRCPLVTGDPEFRRVDGLELDWLGSR